MKNLLPGTAEHTYQTQKRHLLDALKDLEMKIERELKAYDKQIKEKPDSWRGIGKGGDLEHLISQIKELTK